MGPQQPQHSCKPCDKLREAVEHAGIMMAMVETGGHHHRALVRRACWGECSGSLESFHAI